MATSKELEKVLGISHRTVNTWLKGRDDRYLLIQFLMSYSEFDIEERLQKILEKEELIKKRETDFMQDLTKDPVKAGISEFKCVEVVFDSQSWDTSISPDLLLRLEDGTLQVVEFISLLPSSTHLKEKIKKLITFSEEYSLKHDMDLEKNEIVFITKSKKPQYFTKKHDDGKVENLYPMVKILDIDEVAKNLYGSHAIII